jgi:hypothetical protein
MIGPRALSGGEVPLSRPADALAPAAIDDVVLVVSSPDGENRLLGRESKCDVARLVLAGVAARLHMPVDAIERLQTALDELLRRHARDEPATVEFTRSANALTFYVGPLVLLLPDRRRLEKMLETAVDDVVWGDDSRGAWVLARMARRSSLQTTR